MNRKVLMVVLFFAALLSAFAALAATEKDGDVVARDGDFVAYYNGVVKDTKTGLEWYSEPNKAVIWRNARTWAAELSIDGGGWRLPTEAELRALRQPDNRPNYITPLIKIYSTRAFVWMDGRGQRTDSGYWGTAFSFMTSGVAGKYQARNQMQDFVAQALVVREGK